MKLDMRTGMFSLMLVGGGLLSACGGGSSSSSPPTIKELTWEQGVYLEPSTFKSFCAEPRTGASPITGEVYDDQPGSVLEENHWLRSWTNDTYLWYNEVPDLNPADYDTASYFDLLKTDAVTASGKDKDDFHFSLASDDWEAQSQAGVSVSYGIDFAVVSATVPREIVVVLVEPGSAADFAGVARGDRVLAIDGVDINDSTSSGVDTLNAGLAPSDIGELHSFQLQALGGAVQTVSLEAQSLNTTAVQSVQVIDTDTGPVGYMLFTTHIATAEAELIEAFRTLQNASVNDLILDLRYNGGGFLAIASQVSYMVAGPEATANRTFETLQFNDQHPNTNPVTGGSNDPFPFYDESLGYSVASGQALPDLGLQRLFVLTTEDTCSASESIINSLDGIGIEIILIGSGTCGKPYGFYPTDNCGTTFFTIQFQSVNDVGFGDYADGFVSEEESVVGAVSLPGCFVADDYNHAIGDTSEAMLAKALSYRATQSCVDEVLTKSNKPESEVRNAKLIRPQWQSNRIVTPPVQRF